METAWRAGAPEAGRALMIVDVQRGFVTDATRHLPAAIEAIQNRFDRVVATRFYHRPGALVCELLGIEGFARGSPETELAFAPPPGAHVLEKSTYSCVTADFVAMLRDWNVREVGICGIDTDQCVLLIAAELLQHDIRPIVYEDLVASAAGAEYHRAGLFVLRRLIGNEQVMRL